MPRYDNGEPVTKERIQDEEWYPDYQEVMQFICENPSKSVEETYEYFVGTKSCPLRLLRWIVLHVERNKTLAKRSSLIEKYIQHRTADAMYDAENSTSHEEELRHMAAAIAEKLSDEELETYIQDMEA